MMAAKKGLLKYNMRGAGWEPRTPDYIFPRPFTKHAVIILDAL
jgi:hypothetical protein